MKILKCRDFLYDPKRGGEVTSRNFKFLFSQILGKGRVRKLNILFSRNFPRIINQSKIDNRYKILYLNVCEFVKILHSKMRKVNHMTLLDIMMHLTIGKLIIMS